MAEPVNPPFFERKPQAEDLRDKLLLDPRVESAAVQLVPYNGWVVRVIAKRMDLSDLASVAEVFDCNPRVLPRKCPPPVVPQAGARASKGAGQGGTQPPATGQPTAYRAHPCWPTIATAHGEGKGREEIISILQKQGYDQRTAGRQYRHWLKANGLWEK